MSQPLDRSSETQQLGEIDAAAGEFWVRSVFQMPQLGHNLSAFEANRLFMNVDGQRFLDASFASQANIDSDSRSVIAGDLNADGDVDLLIGSVGGGPLRMFLNRIPNENHKVRIELQGTVSNRTAIGARVVLHCGARAITRDLFPANGFMGQSPAELLVGVGQATIIDRLTIRWPNGEVQELEDLAVDQNIQIVEGREGYHSVSF
ncbi:MAG: ASPIC/UnbV domain-containing protein [Planctomycetota bacterium]|nr:ASPIC/UnbV domain-containing protein [Planctomycetota bacterium]